MQYAPIIVFAFNRLDAIKSSITSLLGNKEAKESELYIFVDGARANKEGEYEKVEAVQNYVKGISGFKSVNHTFANYNQGLGPSIIAGVSEVINKYGKAIVLEDDLIYTKNFLAFMNAGLERYEHEQKVFSICGYSNKVEPAKDYKYDTYFCTRSSSWGWATWADRWNSVDWALDNFEIYKKQSRAFCRWGGSDCWSMLQGWKTGKNSSWAIRFCFAQFLQNKLSIFPIRSLVNYKGNDGNGTNSKKYTRMKFELDTKGKSTFSFPDQIILDKRLYRQAMHYHSIYLRIWSRIMYLIY